MIKRAEEKDIAAIANLACLLYTSGAVLGETEYVDLAVRAEAFIRKNLVQDGRLMVRYRDGDAVGEGKLDDYACYKMCIRDRDIGNRKITGNFIKIKIDIRVCRPEIIEEMVQKIGGVSRRD